MAEFGSGLGQAVTEIDGQSFSQTSQAASENGAHQSTAAYAAYVAFVLIVCYTFSFADRQILSLLVGPIKHDLAVSDTRIGLLQGLAFAMFFVSMGLPLGRLADTSSRRNLIAVGVFFWSIMTSACSLARTFTSLFLARIGVGVGEATLSPAAIPLLSDYFPEERLGTALGVYTMGASIGSGLALTIGGAVVDMVSRLKAVNVPILGTMAPWRLAFLVFGLPGFLLALLVCTIREPQRRKLLRMSDGRPLDLRLRDVFAQLAQRWQSMAGISVGMVFQSMCAVAFFAWTPTYFVRAHGWTAGEAGKALGLATLVFCCGGLYAGGVLSDYWQRKGIWEGPLRVAALSSIGMGVFLVLATMIPSGKWAMAFAAITLFFIGLPTGGICAAIQKIFPNQVRGQITAVFFIILNLGGMIVGPLLPGLFSDHLFRNETMIGPSLALTAAISSILMSVIFPMTYRHYRRDYLLANPQLMI